MKFSPALYSLAIAALSYVSTVHAEELPSPQARFAARRELDLAKIDLRNYWQIEYPRQCRNLDAAIELTRCEIENYKTQLREFRPFTQFSIGQPFPITVRNLQMCIKEAELRLDDLQDERNTLVRFHSDQFRVLAWQVHEARLRVAELEARMPEPEQPPAQQP